MEVRSWKGKVRAEEDMKEETRIDGGMAGLELGIQEVEELLVILMMCMSMGLYFGGLSILGPEHLFVWVVRYLHLSSALCRGCLEQFRLLTR